MRNNVYSHAKEGRITDVNYRIYKNEIESAILGIAKVCGNETEKKQILMDLEKRPLDETLCIQYQNTLLEQIAKESVFDRSVKQLCQNTSSQKFISKHLTSVISRTFVVTPGLAKQQQKSARLPGTWHERVTPYLSSSISSCDGYNTRLSGKTYPCAGH
jgi:hypothetical protein